MRILKSRYTISQIYSFIIVIGLAALFGFSNRLTPLYYSDFMCIFILFGSFLVWLLTGFKWEKRIFDRENCLLILTTVLGIFSAHYIFGQSWYYTLKEAIFPITTVFSYYIMSKVYNNRNRIDALKEAIVLGALISSIVSIVAWILLMKGMDILSIGEFLKERNGLPRFSYGRTLVVIGFFISFIELKISRKHKRKYLLVFILGAINILFIMQSRTLVLYMFLSVIATFVIFSKQKKRKLRIIIIGLIAVFVIMLNISEFFATNTQLYGNDPGIRVRFEAIMQYWRYFKENPICGVGFLTTSDNAYLNTILGGERGQYNTSDVGIFGFIVQYGIVGIIWLFLWFKKVITIYVKNYLYVNLKHSTLVLILIIFYLITLINLMFTSNPSFMDISVMMVLTQSMLFYKEQSLERSKQKVLF